MINNTEIDTTPTPIFTSVGNAAVNLMIFCNTDDVLQAKLTVAVVPNGESFAPKHLVIYKTILNPLETLFFSQEKIILEDGDIVYAIATETDETSPIAVVSTVSSLGL
jgi:hypothetical protein